MKFLMQTAALIFLLSASTTFVNAQTSTPAASTHPADTVKTAQDSLPPIDTMPVLKQFIEAVYPAEYVKKGVEGSVTLDLVIDTLGHVDSVAVVKGLAPALDSGAAHAAYKFVFSPAKAAGVAVPVLMEYVYRFSLAAVVDKIDRYVNFKGRLVERGTRAPLRDATVVVVFTDTTKDASLDVPFSAYCKKIGTFDGQHLEENALVTTSDSAGNFRFWSLPAGPVVVRIISPGFEKFAEREMISRSEVTDVKYYLQRNSYGENEIVVYGKEEKKEVTTYTLTINEVRKIPGFGGDAVKVVQALPGVARASFMSGAIVVRGASTADSKFYINGVELPLLYHFGGLKSTYNSDALESVDFYPGGFGTRYGNVTAGVIELKGRAAKTDRWHGTVDANMYDASFMVEGPVNDKVSMLLTARRSYVGDIISAVVDKLKLPFSVQPYYWDYVGRVDVALTKDQKLNLTLFGSEDYLKLVASSVRGGSSQISSAADEAFQKTIFNMGSLDWTWNVSSKVKNEMTYSLTDGDEYSSMFGFYKMDKTAFIHYLRNQTSVTLSDKVVLNTGIDANVYPANVYLQIQGSDTVLSDTVKNWVFGDIGPYVNVDWKPTRRLEIIPGLRYDYFPELDYRGSVLPAFWDYHSVNNHQGGPGEPSLRLTMRYKLDSVQTIKGAIGNYSETPQPLGQSIMARWGDPSLPATMAAQYVAGYEWQISDLVNLDVQTYYNRQWDIPRRSTPADGPAAKGYIADQNGRMYGAEVMLKHDQGKQFFGWLAYSLSRSERSDPHTPWHLFGKDETHNLQLIGNWRLPHFWELGFRARYVTGDPSTPVVGVNYNADDSRFVPVYGPANSSRMDDFFQLDLRVDRKFTFKKYVMSVYLDFQNVSWFFYKSPEFYMYNYDYTQKTAVGSIPYPSFGVTLEF